MSREGPEAGNGTDRPPGARELMERGLEELGIDAPPYAAERLLRYVAEIERWNPALGLVKATGVDLVVRHVLDSLAGLPAFSCLPEGARILDVGSGAGFPGVPLAVARPGLGVVLLDRSSKRTTFLEHCVRLLRLANAEVFCGEARSYEETVDAVTFRAVSPLSPAFLRASGIAALAPLVIAYKGTAEHALAELAAVRELYRSGEVVPVRVPFLEGERTLVVLRR
jgi:16S rRNA (guanine527-N7)-methyltransferase